MTLEEAQQKILDLTEENQKLKQEKETLSQDKKKLEEDNKNLGTLNQKYFNKLIAQEVPDDDDDDDDEPDEPSCEEFAKTLKI